MSFALLFCSAHENTVEYVLQFQTDKKYLENIRKLMKYLTVKKYVQNDFPHRGIIRFDNSV